eukprot:PITA_17653
MKDGSSTHKDFDSIKRVALIHFQNLYREEGETDPNSKFLEAIPPLISPIMNQQLEAKISIQEIKDTLFEMALDKALGPDGFTARFLQTCWQIVEKDLCKMVLKLQSCQKIGGSANLVFLALIPKEKGAKEFNRFHPISLCNIGYKLITKVIANRLKGILPTIIPENQGGFVQGRQLVDNCILVQEVIHSSQLRKEKGMVIKLDLANAFDWVRLSFLWEVLKKFSFGMGFLNWLRACIADPWIAPLVNGRAAGFFKASRGLRQGCPLSPLLFVLQVSVMSFYLDQKLVDQEILGLNIARGVKNVNHTLFADDTLLLGVASARSASSFKKVMDDYSEATGNRLNKGKCKIFCWNILTSTLSSISRILGFTASLNWSSFTYLGLHIFRKLAYSKDWVPLLDKFKAKIQAWGFSWFHKKMEAFIRKFFWKGGNHNDRKIPLVSWEKICKPQSEGGLNFKDLCLQNIAMGAKIFWRVIGSHPGWAQRALWRKYFRGKRKRCLDALLPTSGSQLIKLCQKAVPLIKDRAFWIPGNGKDCRIWKDNIMMNPPLSSLSSLHPMCLWMNNAGCNSLWDISQWEGRSWLRWRLPPIPPELTQARDQFLVSLNGMAPLSMGKKDARGWGAAPGLYTVAQGYKSMQMRPHVPPNLAVWNDIWNVKTTPKVDAFCWLLCHSAILTTDRL